MKIKLPSSSQKSLGKLKQGDDTFVLHNLPNGEAQDEDSGISGQEMQQFTCLLPRRKEGDEMNLGKLSKVREEECKIDVLCCNAYTLPHSIKAIQAAFDLEPAGGYP